MPAAPVAAPALVVAERHRVCRASAAAGAAGIVPGMRVAGARALCSGLLVRERDIAAEQALLAQLAQDALAFTPQVSLAGHPHGDGGAPDTLLLEVGGCLRLFHGLGALRARVQAALAAQGVAARSALARTPAAATLFARHGVDTVPLFDDAGQADENALRQHLSALPVTALGLDPRTEDNIMQMGIHTFADLDALPRAALGRRFGSAFTLWLDRVTGALPDPRRAVAPETFFVRDLNFLDGIAHTDALAFPMQRLLGEFGRFLRHRQLATQHLVWRLTLTDRSTQEITVNTARPEVSPARLLELTRVRLETVRLAAPVETLRLACRRFSPLADAGHDTLFPELGADARRDDGIAALVDRLRARLGDAHCRQLLPVDSWQPEAAQRALPAGKLPPALAATLAPAPSHLARRPLWLLPEPRRVLRDGTHLRWHGTLTLLDGPERIDSHWWDAPLARDYFVAQHGDGALYWVYHDLASDSWYLHGVFG